MVDYVHACMIRFMQVGAKIRLRLESFNFRILVIMGCILEKGRFGYICMIFGYGKSSGVIFRVDCVWMG